MNTQYFFLNQFVVLLLKEVYIIARILKSIN